VRRVPVAGVVRTAVAAAIAGSLLVPPGTVAVDVPEQATAPAAPPGGRPPAMPLQSPEAQAEAERPASGDTFEAPDPENADRSPSAPEPDPEPREPRVVAAASASVRIVNFRYSPATVTVDPGDSVTWVNEDSDPHTATASDGGFDTGTLDQGESGSHRFTEPGSFPYICALHPSMRGTVVVAGATAGAGAAEPAPGAPAAGQAGPAASEGGPRLPATGLQVVVVAVLGAVFWLSGWAMRSFLARR
jgi:plastocyanin